MSYGDLWLNIRQRGGSERNYRVWLMGAHQKLISYDENKFRGSYGTLQ